VEQSKIPLTEAQRDVGMTEDFSGHISLLADAKRQNAVPLMQEKSSFRNMYVQAPELKLTELPECK